MIKSIVLVLGIIFVLMGVFGFFNDPVFGIFDVDDEQNMVHLVSGVIAIATAFISQGSAKTFAKVFGLVYGVVAIMGLAISEGELLGLMEINMANNLLYVFLSVVLIYVGFSNSNPILPNNAK